MEETTGVAPVVSFCHKLAATAATKWLMTHRIGSKKRIHGYTGPRFAEAASSFYHLKTGRYLSYVSHESSKHGRRAMLLFLNLDPHTRKALRKWFGSGRAAWRSSRTSAHS